MPPAKKPGDEAKKPAAKKPAASKPAAKKPAASKPAAKKPAASKPAAKKPAASKPAAKKPAASKPAASASRPAAGKVEPAVNERFGLHSLSPAPGSRRPRRRVGRGEGSGLGKTAGRGQKGYGSRSGAKDRTRFEGGQMPIQKRMRKLRGPNMKKSMPFERFRTHTQAVNIGDLDERFDSGSEVTLEALSAKGLGSRRDVPVKILAKGEISKPLTVHAHGFSASAREAIEGAGGTCVTVEP